jgi:hypothetical protein
LGRPGLWGRLLTIGPTLAFEHYTEVEVVELYFVQAEATLHLLEDDGPTYLLVDVAALEGQWRDYEMAALYRALREAGRLTPLDQFVPYTLFSIDG